MFIEMISPSLDFHVSATPLTINIVLIVVR